MKRPFARLRRLALAFAAALAVYLVVLASLQRTLIYFPARAPESALLAEAERLGLVPWRDPQGALIGWQTPVREPPAARLAVFHGNAGYALDRLYFTPLPPAEWQVLLFEYPGYGARTGSPSETAIQTTALAAVDSLATPGQPPLYLAGESLGSGVAAWLASQRPSAVAGLLLITPLTSLADVAARHYPFLPVRLLLTERYDALHDLRGYAGPVALVLAGRDEVVPAELGRRLHASYGGPKRLWEQPAAGHNSLDFDPSWWAPAFRFLAAPGQPE